MDARALQEYAARDWGAVADARRDHWAALYNRDPRAVWDAAQGLLAHIRRVRSDYPSPEQRQADLEAHALLRARLDAAAHAFTGR